VGPRYSPGGRRFEYISNLNEFKLLQNLSNFAQSKNGLPYPENFEIKYSFEALEKMNNFLYRNFLKFGIDFN
jgi:vacuolar-type H+-ATPase subunit C/Vma6